MRIARLGAGLGEPLERGRGQLRPLRALGRREAGQEAGETWREAVRVR
jgi:hypothetical protein